MNSEHLQRWQITRLQQQIAPMLTYLQKLRTRMEKVGFLPADPMYDAVA